MSAIALSSQQIQHLMDGLQALGERMPELGQDSRMQAVALGLNQSLTNVLDLPGLLQDELCTPLIEALHQAMADGEHDATALAARLEAALSSTVAQIDSAVTQLESLSDGTQIVWFTLDLRAGTTLDGQVLNLSQDPNDPGSLYNQGLRIDEVSADVWAGLSGQWRIGVVLDDGLPADQAVRLDVPLWSLCLEGSAALSDVQATFGVLDLGPATANLEIQACLDMQSLQGASGELTLGQWRTMDWTSAFSVEAEDTGTSAWQLSLPFDLGIAGFDSSSSSLTLNIVAANGFDGDFHLEWPELSIGGTPFDFDVFTRVDVDDLGFFLTQLPQLLRDWVGDVDLPGLGLSIDNLSGIDLDLTSFLDHFRGDDGHWNFTGLQSFMGQLAEALGIPEADIESSLALQWSPAADALEWKLPWSFTVSGQGDASVSDLMPGDLGMQWSGQAQVQASAALTLDLTVGLALTDEANVVQITSATLLSSLNSGLGLKTQGLVTGDDVSFTLSNGTSVGIDLNPLVDSVSTSTVADLITLINADSPSLLQASLSDNRLVLTDLSGGSGVFSVSAPQVTASVGTSGYTVDMTSISVAPLVLGWWGLTGESDGTGHSVITGNALGSVLPMDRLYLATGSTPLLDGHLSLSATLEGGASLGPLSLSVVDGEIEGSADWEVSLVDTGVGDDDGRLYLSEWINADTASVFEQTLQAPVLDGILQLQVSPDAMATTLDIDNGDYSSTPILTASTDANFTYRVPYLDLSANASDWSLSLEPSEKLKALLEQDFGQLSWERLPDLLSALLNGLSASDLWNLPIPLLDLSFGDLLGIQPDGLNLSWPDLGLVLDADASGGGLDGWNLDFQTALDLAWPDLDGASPDLALQLRGLQWELGRMALEWDGRTGDDPAWNFEFMGRMGAWLEEFRLALDDLSGLSGTWAGTLSLSLQDLFGRFDALPLGIEGLEVVLSGMLPAIDGLQMSIDIDSLDWGTLDLSEGDSGWQAPKLMFNLSVGIDAASALTRSYALADLDLGDVTLAGVDLLQFKESGEITLSLYGHLSSRFGIDLSDLSPEFSTDDLHADFYVSVTAPSLELGVSLGGLAGVSVGSIDQGDPATITLTDAAGSSAPAHLSFDGSNGMTDADAYFAAHLPVFVSPIVGKVASLEMTGTLVGSATDVSFDPSLSFHLDQSNFMDFASLGLDGWIEGAIAFIDGLTLVLESDLVGQLPFVPDVDFDAPGTFLGSLRSLLVSASEWDTLGEFSLNLNGLFDSGAGLGGSFGAGSAFTFWLDGLQVDTDPSLMALSLDELFSGTYGQLTVMLNLDYSQLDHLEAGQIDLGLDGLGVSLSGSAGLDLYAALGLDLGLSYDFDTHQFAVVGASGNEVTLDLGVGLDGETGLALNLGPLALTVSDNTPGDVSSNEDSRELHAQFGLDVGSGALSLEGLSQDLTVNAEVRALLDVNLTSNIGLGASLTTGFYDTDQAPVTFSWSPGSTADFSDSLDSSLFHFNIDSTYIDLESLFGPALTEMAAQLSDLFEPIDPVLDMLTAEIPLISDLSEQIGQGPVTYLDAISWFGEGAAGAAEFVAFLAHLSDISSDLASTGRFELGGLSAPTGGASSPSLSAMDSSALTNQAITSEQSTANEGLLSGLSTSLAPLGISLPFLDSPGAQLANLLFGGDVELIHWDIPDLNASFDFRKSFPVFPPLYVALFGGVSFNTNFDLGYDTRGIRQALDSGDPTDLINGVYLVDTGHSSYDLDHSASGGDLEMSMTAQIGAGAELNVVVAQAGVDGGLRGTLGADLKDPNNDGKVYVDEFVDNLLNGPECIFDYEGALTVFLEAFIKVGIDTPFGFVTLYKDRFKLAEATLLDWSLQSCPPAEPVLAEQSGSTLTLNTGARASLVMTGVEDGDEVFYVDVIRNADGSVVTGSGAGITVAAYNDVQSFVGVNEIDFDAGNGNDSIVFSPQVLALVSGHGGSGSDNLVGGSGINRLYGDDGDDVLSGRASADQLSGGNGDDVLYGFGGNDSLSGGAGDDALFGDDDNGDLAAFNASNADYLAGSAGNDSLDGGEGDDALVAGEGNDLASGGNGDDVLQGQAGNDTLAGDAGNDQVQGDAGNDWLYGDDVDGTVTGGSDVLNADKIQGGDGFNVLVGGTGDDLLYAVDEIQQASASVSGTSPFARGWHSILLGGDGQDMMYGTAGADSMQGGAGSDYLGAGEGANWVYGGGGSDALIDGAGASTLLGGTGDDVVDAGGGNDWVEGGIGDDQLYAREGQDTVWGGTTDTDVVPGMVGTSHYDLQVADGVDEHTLGGFRSTPSPDNCGPEIQFSPPVRVPVPPEETSNPHTVQVSFFKDDNQDGQHSDQERLITGEKWQVYVLSTDGNVVAEAQGTSADGHLSLSSTEFLPGDYQVVVIQGSRNDWLYTQENSVVQGLHIADAQSPLPEFYFGFAQYAQLSGTVQGDGNPRSGQTVFLDEDADLVLDAGERWTLSDSAGGYAFDDLVAGQHALVVLADRPESVIYQSSSASAGWVSLTLNAGSNRADLGWQTPGKPVVSAVSLGQINPETGVSAIVLSDGPQQAETVSLDSHAMDRVSLTLLGSSEKISPRLNLQKWDGVKWNNVNAGTQVQGSQVHLNLQSALTDGHYRVVLAQDLGGGDVLDGEWVNALVAGDLGDRFVSGNGVSGGDFVYEFSVAANTTTGSLVAGPQTMAFSVDTSRADLGVGQAEISGEVWLHDASGASPAREALEPGLSAQTIRLLDSSGTELARVHTAADGSYAFTGLGAGTYRVEQIPDALWVQAVRLASTEHMLAVAATSRTSDSLIQIRLDGVMSSVAVSEKVYDIALVNGNIVYSGIDKGGLKGLWAMKPDGSQLQVLSSGANFPVLVGMDALPSNDTLVGVDGTGHLWTYQIGAHQWTDIKALSDGAATLLPIGDLALNADGSAWLVARYSNDAAHTQFLVQVNPANGQLLATPVRIESKTQAQWIGLDWVDHQLLVLGDSGTVRELSLSSPGRAIVMDTELQHLTVSGDSVHGGLAWMNWAQSLSEPISLSGDQKAEVLFGDTVNGSALIDHDTWKDGNDFIDGGCGNEPDVLMGDDSQNLPGVSSGTLVLEGGDDVIRGRGGDDTLVGGLQSDLLMGEDGNDRLTGGSKGNNRLLGGNGDDTLTGGSGDDQLLGEAGQDSLQGMDGNDGLYGGDGQDTLLGGNGADVLVGGNDSDTVRGEAGNDTLVVTQQGMGTAYNSSLMDGASGLYDGGADSDTLVVVLSSETTDQHILLDSGTVQVGTLHELQSNIERAWLVGGAGNDHIDATLFGGSSDQQGQGGQDSLLGGAGNDRLRGGAGNDQLSAGSGNDSLDGGTGDNRLDGGPGQDAYHLSDGSANMPSSGMSQDSLTDASDTDSVDASDLPGSQRVTLLSDGRFTLEQLDSSGSTLQSLTLDGTGPSLAEGLRLGDGNDTLNSANSPGVGITSVDAGVGEDWLDYRYAGSAAEVDLSTGLATGWAAAIGVEHVSGSAQSDRLRGDAGNNVFIAHGGSDTIDGVSGQDVLWLEAPDSSSTSGVTARLSGAAVVVGDWYGGSFTAHDTLTLSAIDTVGGSGQADRFMLTNPTSPALFLDGGPLTGGYFSAPDTIEGVVAEDFSPYMVNTLDYSLYAGAVTVNLSLGTATGTAGIARWDRVIGGAAGDILIGNAQSQALEGGAHNDALLGGAGDDYLVGGSGNDLLVGGFGFDTAGYEGKTGDYTVTLSADGLSYQVLHKATGHTDLLLGIEQLAFYSVDSVSGWITTDRVMDPATLAAGLLHAVAGLKIIGHVREDSILSVAYSSLRGGITAAQLHWQWLADGVALPGKTGTHLELTQSMVGQTISLQASVEIAPGMEFDAGEVSASGTVSNVNDLPTGRPWISGSALLGQTLRVHTDALADEDGLGAFHYQWYARTPMGLKAISGATTDQLKLTEALNGLPVAVQVSYTDAQGQAEELMSELYGQVRMDRMEILNPMTALPATGTLSWQILGGRPDLPQSVHEVRLMASQLPFATGDIASLKLALMGHFSQVASWTLTDANGRNLSSLIKGTASLIDLQIDYASNQALADKDGVVFTLRIVMQSPAPLSLPALQVGSACELVTANGEHWQLSPQNLGVSALDQALPTGRVTLKSDGTLHDGSILRAEHNLADANGLGDLSYTWFADGQIVQMGRLSSLQLTQATVGKKISVEVSYQDGLGKLEVVSSIDSPRIQNQNDAPSGHLDITGTMQQNQWLSVHDLLADTDGLGTRAYTWMAGNQTLGTGDRLQLTQSMVGQTISLMARYTDGFGAQEQVSVSAQTVVQNTNDRPTGSVQISGTLRQGELLQASQTLQDADGMPHAPLFTWYAGSTVVGNGASLRLSQAHVGKSLTVQARYTDGYGTPEAVSSAGTALIGNINDAPVLLKPVPDQSFTSSAMIKVLLSDKQFGDLDGDKLSYKVYYAPLDSSVPQQLSPSIWEPKLQFAELPSWLRYSPTASAVVSTQLTGGSFTDFALKVVASDGKLDASDVFIVRMDRSKIKLSGKVIDGYVAGAHIYVDANGDGIAQDNEDTGLVTDAQGRFDGEVSASGPIIAFGGTNVDTGLPNVLPLRAPQGATVVSPVTTLVQSMVDQGASLNQATTQLSTVFGLDASLNLLNFDPMDSSTDDADALAVHKLNVQLALAGTLVVSLEGNAAQLADEWAQVVLQHTGAPLDLSQSSLIESVFTEVVGSEQAQTISTQLSTALQSVGQSSTQTQVAQTQHDIAQVYIDAIADTTAPQWVSANPTASSRQVALDASLQLVFDENIQAGSGTLRLETLGGTLVESFDAHSSRVSWSGHTLTIDPTALLSSGTRYRVLMPAGWVQDASGNTTAQLHDWTFTTQGVQSGVQGDDGDDQLTGSSGNDVFRLGLGNDSVMGGAGQDRAHLAMFPNVYALSAAGDRVSGSYIGFQLHLDSVEQVSFGEDFETVLDVGMLTGGQAQEGIGRLTDLYLSFFGRAPDVAGLEYWMQSHFNGGKDLARIAKDFSWSQEALTLFPTTMSSNREFVNLVYVNCFGRNAEQAGLDWWTNRLDALNPSDPDYLNNRGVFVGELLLGAYATTSGSEDRTLLIHRHDVAMAYANSLSTHREKGFDSSINDLLSQVNGAPASKAGALAVIEHVFEHPISLTGVMSDPVLLQSLWTSQA